MLKGHNDSVIVVLGILQEEFWKKSIPREQPNQNKEMKIADSVLLSLLDHETRPTT